MYYGGAQSHERRSKEKHIKKNKKNSKYSLMKKENSQVIIALKRMQFGNVTKAKEKYLGPL